MQFKIFKFVLSDQIAARFFVDHHTIFHMELVVFGYDPLREVAVQQLDGLAPFGISLLLQRRGTEAGPLPLIPLRTRRPALQLFPFKLKFIMWMGLSLGPLWGDRKAIALINLGILDFRNGTCASYYSHKTSHQGLISRGFNF